jgi:hypothetical protein
MNRLKNEILKRLSLSLIIERELDVGDDIKIAIANSDDVLVDFPKKIIADEILVDFPNNSLHGNNSESCDSLDEDDAFLDFPKERRNRRLSAQNSANFQSQLERVILPDVVVFPTKSSNTTNPAQSYTNASSRSLKSLFNNDTNQETLHKSENYEIRGRSSQASCNPVTDMNTSTYTVECAYDHSAILSKVESYEKSDETYGLDSERNPSEEFVKPSNWIDSEDSDSDEGSEAYRQRIYREIEAKKGNEWSNNDSCDESVCHADEGQELQCSNQEVKVRPPLIKSKSHRRPSMSMKVNTLTSQSLDGNSPFSQGFEFAKVAPVVQMKQKRRQSITNTTYDFEKGLEVKPRPARRNSINTVDANLVSGLRAFGAKGHDIRRILT